ncbi:putative dna-bridging protein baf, partial [Operophtera brumata]
MTTTIKHRKFAIEPMGKKSVTELPGIGDVLGKRLQEKGIKLESRWTNDIFKIEKLTLFECPRKS